VGSGQGALRIEDGGLRIARRHRGAFAILDPLPSILSPGRPALRPVRAVFTL
jgi:hypothetical protein